MALSRLLVLQLDSVPWPVLKPLMDAGRAPRLKALYERGCSGTLRSTVPPITPAAWATFMTGVRPGRHGILNFKGFDPRRQSYCVADARHLSERNIYRRLALAGKRVGVAMQPSTHPPFDVNGFCLTGFDSPGLSAPFAHPRELEAEILALCPEHGQNFNLHSLWAKPAREGEDVLPRNLEAAAGQMRRVAKLALDLHARHPVDVLAVYFQAPDVVLHKAWPYCLPEGGQENPARREAVARFFGAMDAACGDLIDGFGGAGETLTLALSDHGHQPARHAVFVNTLLAEGGFLKYARSPAALARDAVRRVKDLARGIKRRGLSRPLDWNSTLAWMPYQACSGMVYVNLKGRQPFGCVEERDYESVRDRVLEFLRAAKLPDGAPVCADVVSGDAFFDAKLERGLPDILMLQHEGVDFRRRAIDAPFARPLHGRAGIHHPDGLYILDGPGVAARKDADGEILDMAPTLLAALGQPVPSYMEARARADWFAPALEARIVEQAWGDGAAAPAGYTQEQEAAIEERLADLGYLD